jgi:hypothetical protein
MRLPRWAKTRFRRRLEATDIDDGLAECLQRFGETWLVRKSPYDSTAAIFARLAAGEEPRFVEEIRNQALRFCSERSVPVPAIGWGMVSSEAVA